LLINGTKDISYFEAIMTGALKFGRLELEEQS
jgi:hypothetical protein